MNLSGNIIDISNSIFYFEDIPYIMKISKISQYHEIIEVIGEFQDILQNSILVRSTTMRKIILKRRRQ